MKCANSPLSCIETFYLLFFFSSIQIPRHPIVRGVSFTPKLFICSFGLPATVFKCTADRRPCIFIISLRFHLVYMQIGHNPQLQPRASKSTPLPQHTTSTPDTIVLSRFSAYIMCFRKHSFSDEIYTIIYFILLYIVIPIHRFFIIIIIIPVYLFYFTGNSN